MSDDARQDVLDAARDLFADRGFAQVTIRDIAARAGVSPALVMKCGGSKKDLFHRTAVITPPPLPDVPLDRLGAALVDQILERRERDQIEHLVRALVLRISSPDPDAVRVRFLGGYVEPLAAILPGPDPRRRAELVVAALTGLAASIRLFDLPDRSADGTARDAYGHAVQALIDGTTPRAARSGRRRR